MGLLLRLPPPLWTDKDARCYRVHMPHDLTIVAACEDVGCDQWRHGWETVCDESDDMGAQVAMLIRSGQAGRTYREYPGSPVTVFRFDAGQRCFREHRTRPGRMLVHQAGRIVREHVSLGNLAEDYTEHIGRLADQA